MITSLARIPVQNTFCKSCIAPIKKKLQEIERIKNIALYPSDSLVVFNFDSANQVSEVLNTLTDLGYPPEGERTNNNDVTSMCNCTVHA